MLIRDNRALDDSENCNKELRQHRYFVGGIMVLGELGSTRPAFWQAPG